MAHKKKGSKKHHHRRMGAVRGGGLMTIFAAVAGAGGGVILGRMLNNMINPATSVSPNVSPTILGAGEAAVGGLVAGKMNKPGWQGALIKSAALGFGGNGFMYMLSSKGLNVLPASIGYGPDPMHRALNRATMQGFRDVPKIGAAGPARFPAPGAIGATADRARMRRIYSGIYG